MEGTKKIKSMSFHQYSWNSEVDTTWISLIGWHHKTSNNYAEKRNVFCPRSKKKCKFFQSTTQLKIQGLKLWIFMLVSKLKLMFMFGYTRIIARILGKLWKLKVPSLWSLTTKRKNLWTNCWVSWNERDYAQQFSSLTLCVNSSNLRIWMRNFTNLNFSLL